MSVLPPHYRRVFAGLVLLYGILVGWMIVRLPAFASPNEALHYEVVALLRRNGTLPEPIAGNRADERHQAPLYYLLAGLAAWPFPEPLLDTDLPGNPHFAGTLIGNRNPKVHADWSVVPVLYAGRAVTLFFGVIGLFGLLWATSPLGIPSVRLLAVSLFAFHPMVLFLSASLSNDLPVAAMGAVVLGGAMELTTRRRTVWAFAGWGLLWAAAVLTKASAIFLGLLFPWMLYAQWRDDSHRRQVIVKGLAAPAVFSAVWSVWLFYNRARGIDLLGVERSVPLAELASLRPGDLTLLLPHLPTYWRSIHLDWSVGKLGWGPPVFYWVMAIVWGVGLGGWLIRRRAELTHAWVVWPHVIWTAPLVMIFFATNLLVIRAYGVAITEGRLLVLTLTSAAWLLAGGWARWWPSTLRPWAVWVALVLYVGGSVAQATWLLPALYPRAQVAAAATLPFTPVAEPVTYGGQLRLFLPEVPDFQVGHRTRTPLVWQALDDLTVDYTISVQLLLPVRSGVWPKLDWQNSYPGAGLNPTAGWRAGDLVTDFVVLQPAAQLNGPTLAHLVVWVLDKPVDGQTLLAIQGERPVDPPVVSIVVVQPATPISVPPLPGFVPVDFGGIIRLTAAALTGSSEQPELALYWEAIADGSEDYVVFVHWLDANGVVVAQSDGPPNQGLSPTSIWRQGDVVRDRFTLEGLTIPVAAVRVGLYQRETSARLPAQRAAERLPDDALPVVR